MSLLEPYVPLVAPALISAFAAVVATKVIGGAWLAAKVLARGLWWITFGWWLRALWNRYIG